MASRDSVESQRRGVVAIAHPNGICFELENSELYLVHRLSVSVPTRMVASHNFCLDFSGYRLLAKVVVAHVISGAKHKQIIRQKFHVGLNDTEMRYYLQGFGIPIQFIPLTETGTIKLNYFNKWLKTRTYIETREKDEEESKNRKADGQNPWRRTEKPPVVVECPLLNDVVFRQGKPYKANPGNDVLRDSILEELNRKMLASLDLSNSDDGNNDCTNELQKHSAQSNSTGTSEASTETFCDWLIGEIQTNRKGRFLTWDGTINCWVLMTDGLKIRRKISVAQYNYEKRHSTTLGKVITERKESAEMKESSSLTSLSGSIVGSSPTPLMVKSASDDLAYRFIEGGKEFSARNFFPLGGCGNNKKNESGERKRSRDSWFSPL